MDDNINYEYILRYLRRTLEGQMGELAEIEKRAVKMNLPIARIEVIRFLQAVIMASGAKQLLEIGTAIGYSGLSMLEAAGEGASLVTVEKSSELADIAEENFKGKNVRLIRGDGVEELSKLDGEFDFIFVDAAKGQYAAMLPDALRLLKPNGLILSDNVLYKGMVATDDLRERREITIIKRMRNYLDMICKHPGLHTSIIPIGDGVAMSIKKQTN